MKWLTASFVLFIILIIFLADTDRLGILAFINQIPYGDKVGHFVLYGILTLLIDLTLFSSVFALKLLSPGRLAVVGGLILALLIGLEEYSQKFFASRTYDLIDLTFSYLGVIFFSLVSLRIIKSKGRS